MITSGAIRLWLVRATDIILDLVRRRAGEIMAGQTIYPERCSSEDRIAISAVHEPSGRAGPQAAEPVFMALSASTLQCSAGN